MADPTRKQDDLFLKHLGLGPKEKSAPVAGLSSPKAKTGHAETQKVDFQKELGKYLSRAQLQNAAKKDSRTPVRAATVKKDPSRPDEVLDLHQLTVAKAMTQIHWTIQRMLHARQTTLLIITGKGLHSENGPVLKTEVVHWLSHSPLVKSFGPAPSKLGGSGAQLVEIKSEG